MGNNVGTYSYMNISDNNEPNNYGEIEIYETLDAPEETKTYEDLDN